MSWKTKILVTLVLAALVHFITVLAIPYVISSDVKRGLLERGQVNSFIHGTPRTHGPENKIPQSNPDFLPSVLFYDVSEKPLRIHLAVPGSVPYWSFSLFASNIDNYYVLNDRDIKQGRAARGPKEIELVLVGPEVSYQAQGDELVVTSPSSTGFGLIRMIVKDRYSKQGLKEVEKLKKIQVMSKVEETGGNEM